jgi:hypothetical protein
MNREKRTQHTAHAAFKPIKPSTVRSKDDKTDALNEYRAEQQAQLKRMSLQRAARLNAAQALKLKNAT